MIDEEVFTLSLQRWRKALVHLAEMEDELLEQGFVPFTATLTKGNRITVPYEVVRKLKLKEGDWILIPAFKLLRTEIPPKKKRKRKRKPPVEPELIVKKPIEEPVEEPTVEPIIEPVVETESEVAEEVSEETQKASQIVPPSPMIREPVKPKEDTIKEEQKYAEQCPKGLDWPLQDLKACRGLKCEHYKRKHGKSPQACKWTWKKIGEDEEEPVEDVPIEEPMVEEEVEDVLVEEPIPEPEPEEPVKVGELATVRRLCKSLAHDGIFTHRWELLKDGRIRYTCAVCGNITYEDKAERVEVESERR